MTDEEIKEISDFFNEFLSNTDPLLRRHSKRFTRRLDHSAIMITLIGRPPTHINVQKVINGVAFEATGPCFGLQDSMLAMTLKLLGYIDANFEKLAIDLLSR
jgi:hypothetical protein